MPEKPRLPGVDRCNKCTTSDGAGRGPSPTTHAEICCLYRLAHPGQSDAFLNEEGQKRCDSGRCKDCPSRLQLQNEQLQVSSASEPPELTTSDPPQEGILPLAAGTGSQLRKHKKIEPRLRQGFKNLTLEIRPRRFKKKLWFGTYTTEEIDRARDAVNYYMGCNQPYTHPDSPLIFASKPLKGIRFEDLQPSCDDFVQVGDVQELKYKYFARQVKEVIHSVTGKQKKSSGPSTKRKNRRVSQSGELGICDPPMPSETGSTPASSTQEHQVARDPTDSQLFEMHPSCLPPAEMLTYDEHMQFYELLRTSNNEREEMFSLEAMFTFTSVVAPSGSGESSTMEEEDFPSNLWSFQNEGLP